MSDPIVSVVIPHYLGDIILECLRQLYDKTDADRIEVLVVDDQPYDDGSLARVSAMFPTVRMVPWQPVPGWTPGMQRNRGYGAGCNRGLEVARGRYTLLLNNDVIVQDGWLEPLIEVMESDSTIAACQPKLISVHQPDRFDYSGAAGGMMDAFGYAFCLGRLFDEVEVDRGQYDTVRDIFWTIGGAMFLRMSALRETGMMDEGFEMHMEEIDLCWRLHLAGRRIVSAPQSQAHHYGAMSLPADTFRKAYFNHRNNLVMIFKNWAPETLVWAFPVRLLMEAATVLLAPLKGDWRHPAAALLGLLWLISHPGDLARRRRQAQASRKVADSAVFRKQFRGSAVTGFFIRGRRTAADLMHKDRPARGPAR